jgi:hypothetical protein
LRWDLTNFLLSLTSNLNLPIASSWVARITDLSHHAQLIANIFTSNNRRNSSQGRKQQSLLRTDHLLGNVLLILTRLLP